MLGHFPSMLSDRTAGERTLRHFCFQSSRVQRVVENSAINIRELLRDGEGLQSHV